MRWRAVVAVAVASAASGLLAVPLAQQPQFTGQVDLVPVYVSVRSGGSIVDGLGVRDFSLTDNVVPQEIDSVSADALPIDVTLVVDTSSSVISSLTAFKTDVGRIASLLRPDEQMRLITFDTDVRQILPMQRVTDPPVSEIRLGDYTSLNDALLVSLARTLRFDRRHLVFVFTDGDDTWSVLDSGALPEMASRADAVLHVVQVRPNVPPEVGFNHAISLLAEAAMRTGGALYPPSGPDDIVAAFARAIEDFRRSYVLFYSPRGVKPDGWHTLGVRVVKSGSGSYDVRARLGYYAR